MELSNSFILPLADHLHYAVVRARDGVRVQYPLAPEVTVLYPREVEYGRTVLAMVRERLQVELDPNEAIPLALHLVNAQFATADMSQAFRMTEVFAQVFEIIEASYERKIDPDSMSAARFVTHLRYLLCGRAAPPRIMRRILMRCRSRVCWRLFVRMYRVPTHVHRRFCWYCRCS